jgi:hypothetical protein
VAPRPDATAAPEAYARWAKAATFKGTRVTPQLKQTNVVNGPMHAAATAQAPRNTENGIIGTSSTNWSGEALVSTAKKPPFTMEEVESYFTVPNVTVPFSPSTCADNSYFGSEWVGIDGFNSGDVFQAGLEMDAQCSGGTISQYYTSWYEWYPNDETAVDNTTYPVLPGDLIEIYVWNVSSTQGYAHFYDWTQNYDWEIEFSAPNPYALVGDSVEWVVEAPTVNSNQSALVNYLGVSAPDGYAYNYAVPTKKQKYYYPGSTVTGVKNYNIWMIDGSGGPYISEAYLEGKYDVQFYDDGPAYCTTC